MKMAGRKGMTKMTKKQRSHHHKSNHVGAPLPETKIGSSLKELLNEDALAKLKQLERDVKAQKEREAQEAAERKRREQEERERNKSFAELLDDYEKKGGGKYS
jgi:hypothetical protein